MEKRIEKAESAQDTEAAGVFGTRRRKFLLQLAGLPLLAGFTRRALGETESSSSDEDPIEAKIKAMRLSLPPPIKTPPGVEFPFVMVRVNGKRATISGHGPQVEDGSLSPIKGKLGAEVSIEDGYHTAKLTALSILGSLKREIGNLDRVANWSRVFGMVACTPDFAKQPAVINGFSDLILELYGPERGAHSRSAVGMAALPFGIPVEIEAELELK